MYKRQLQDHDLCIGCQTCVNSCPYGAPVYFPEENKTRKCDGCIDWVENGMLPACVGACSTRCLDFGTAESVVADRPGAVRDLSVLPSAEETGPNFFFLPKEEMV